MGQSALIEVICGGIQRHWCSTLGLEPKAMAVRYSVSSANILCGIHMLFFFILHLTALSPFAFVPHMKNSAKVIPQALSSVGTIADVTNPVDALMYPSSATNSTRKSAPTPPLPWPVSLWSQWVPGPRCIQLAWLRKLGQLGSLATRITTISTSSTAHQDCEFHPKNPRKSLQVPSHHSNSCFILGHKTELSSLISVTTFLVWIYDKLLLNLIPGH